MIHKGGTMKVIDDLAAKDAQYLDVDGFPG
jgi:hypothetical protein